MPIINTSLTFKDLPPPPSGKTGWPWTEDTQPLPKWMPDGSECTRISIVTPSYNQSQFLEETIRSVLLQGYPNLEYIIIDGGSTDSSVEIIKKYEQYLAFWVSELDRGQSHAINKGFAKCTGDYIAWMNSDDCYMPNALRQTFNKVPKPQYDLIYGYTYMGEFLKDKQVIPAKWTKIFDLKYLLRAFYNIEYVIPSQSVFVSKKLFTKVGFLKENLHYWMDLDWFARMALEHPLTYRHQEPICFYRLHNEAKTRNGYQESRAEAIDLAKAYSVYLPLKEQQRLSRLISYSNTYEDYRTGGRESSLPQLVKTMIDFPIESLKDRRFLGLLKRALIKTLGISSK